MTTAENLEQLKSKWENKFPDVPWNSRKIFIAVDQSFSSQVFSFIFEGITHLPSIEFEWREGSSFARHESKVETSLSEDGLGVQIKMINFDSSQLKGFIIQQVAPVRHAHLVCLQKDPSTDELIVIYNSIDRCEQLQQQVLSKTINYEPLRFWIDALLNRDQLKAEKFMESDPLLSKLISQQAWITCRFNLEAVLHGLKKTFRYWTDEEKKMYLREAVSIIDALRPLSENACIFGGAALGWAREGKLLDHDDDLDIFISLDKKIYPDLAVALDAVTQILNVAGWEITGTFFSHLWVSMKSKVVQNLDVFIGLNEDAGISCYPMKRAALKSDRIFPALLRTLHGVQVPMPLDIEHYFEVDYGPDWRTPSPNYSIEWDRSHYIDLVGIRKTLPISTRKEVEFLKKLAWIA